MAIKIISCPYKNCWRIFNKQEELQKHIEAIHYDEKLDIEDMWGRKWQW